MLGGIPVSARLQKHIKNFTVLVDRTPQIVLLAPDIHEDFINEEGIAIALVVALQPFGISGGKFDGHRRID